MSGLRERNRRTAMADLHRTAMAMMQASGFSNVTVEQIAESAGVSPSTVYRYFGTKEALVLWGGRAASMVENFATTKVNKKQTVNEAFIAAACGAYDDSDVVAQLALVFANHELTVAFEHEIFRQRGALAKALAAHRGATSVGWRDDGGAGSLLGGLIAVLERWSTSGADKELSKQLAKSLPV